MQSIEGDQTKNVIGDTLDMIGIFTQIDFGKFGDSASTGLAIGKILQCSIQSSFSLILAKMLIILNIKFIFFIA